jgi:hypothetical protein
MPTRPSSTRATPSRSPPRPASPGPSSGSHPRPTARGTGSWPPTGVFSFGDAPFAGSAGGRPATGIAGTRDGHGYWILAGDGTAAAFGDAAPVPGAEPPPVYWVGSQMLAVTDPTRPTPARGGVAGHPGRDLPTLVLFPVGLDGAALPGPWPLVTFAHGDGTTPETYLPLLQAWASDGYVVAAPFLPGERGDLPGTPNQSDRPQEPADLCAVISAVLALAAPSPLAGVADPEQPVSSRAAVGRRTRPEGGTVDPRRWPSAAVRDRGPATGPRPHRDRRLPRRRAPRVQSRAGPPGTRR